MAKTEDLEEALAAGTAWGMLRERHPEIVGPDAEQIAREVVGERKLAGLSEGELGEIVGQVAKRWRQEATVSGSVEKMRRDAGWEW